MGHYYGKTLGQKKIRCCRFSMTELPSLNTGSKIAIQISYPKIERAMMNDATAKS
jgi:hypothetical protein